MGTYIARKLVSGFRVTFQSYDGSGKRIPERTIKQDEYQSLGLSSDMSFEEAKVRISALNKQKTLEEKRQRALVHKDYSKLFESAYLPELLVREFEAGELGRGKKAPFIWNAAKKALFTIKVDPASLGANEKPLFNYMYKQKFSVDYSRRIVIFINRWLEFYSRKAKTAFTRIDTNNPYEFNRIAEQYFLINGKGKEGDALLPEELDDVKGKLKPDYWNWLYIAMWFGLRPSELDRLKAPNPRYWKLEPGTPPRLHIYQTKLVMVRIDKRWKKIPIKYEEQVMALKLVMNGKFRRPTLKALKLAFPSKHVTAYSGRKSFGDIMFARGEEIVIFSRWLGHQKIDTTYQTYMGRD